MKTLLFTIAWKPVFQTAVPQSHVFRFKHYILCLIVTEAKTVSMQCTWSIERCNCLEIDFIIYITDKKAKHKEKKFRIINKTVMIFK